MHQAVVTRTVHKRWPGRAWGAGHGDTVAGRLLVDGVEIDALCGVAVPTSAQRLSTEMGQFLPFSWPYHPAGSVGRSASLPQEFLTGLSARCWGGPWGQLGCHPYNCSCLCKPTLNAGRGPFPQSSFPKSAHPLHPQGCSSPLGSAGSSPAQWWHGGKADVQVSPLGRGLSLQRQQHPACASHCRSLLQASPLVPSPVPTLLSCLSAGSALLWVLPLTLCLLRSTPARVLFQCHGWGSLAAAPDPHMACSSVPCK